MTGETVKPILDKLRKKMNDRRWRVIAAILAIVLIALLVRGLLGLRRYSSYKIVKSGQAADSVSSYMNVDSYVLRYSADGAALIKSDLSTVWDESYTMTNAAADSCGSEILVYDRNGTSVEIFNEKKKVSSFSTELPIISAKISGKDTVAALLDDGDSTEFCYYDSDGNVIASGISAIGDTGSPVALDISDDGMEACVSYVTAASGSVGTTLSFYDFSSSKKKADKCLVLSKTYDGDLIPVIQYMKGSELAAVRDDGFLIFSGASKPSVTRSVDFDSDIASFFCSDKLLGFTFAGSGEDYAYSMKIYTAGGRLKSSSYIDQSYTGVHMSGSQVVFSSASDFSVYTTGGHLKYSGNVEDGNVSDALKIGPNRYILVTDQVVETVRLK